MKHKTLILLSSTIFAGVLLRIIPAWGQVFTGGRVNFVGPDSWYHALTMKNFITSFPEFTFHAYQMYDAFIGILFGMAGTGISFFEHVVVFLPVVIFVITTLIVFVIGKEIAGKAVGIVAVFVFCLLPGEYLNRSMLGSIDHHVVEVFLTTTTIMFLVLASKKTKWAPLYLALAVVSALIYSQIWQGYLLFLPVFAVFFLVVYKRFALVLMAFIILLGIYLYWQGYFSLQPVQTAQTTTEAVPGWSNLIILSRIILTFVLLFTVGKNNFRLPLVAWSGILAVATFWQIRFDYYLIVPLSLLVGIAGFRLWGFVRAGDVIKKRTGAVMVGCVGLCFFSLAMLPVYVGLHKLQLPIPSTEWRSSLEWVKENTPEDSLIVAWWDYGYYIQYIADRGAYTTPGQGAEELGRLAELFNSDSHPPDLVGFPQPCYFMVDSMTAHEFLNNISLWDGGRKSDNPFVTRLYDGYLPDGWELVQGSEVKIWRVE